MYDIIFINFHNNSIIALKKERNFLMSDLIFPKLKIEEQSHKSKKLRSLAKKYTFGDDKTEYKVLSTQESY